MTDAEEMDRLRQGWRDAAAEAERWKNEMAPLATRYSILHDENQAQAARIEELESDLAQQKWYIAHKCSGEER